jgi:predicted nucleic acid-binding protein
LDTNLVSQLIKVPAEPGVLEWIEAQDEEDLFLSAVTVFEIRCGIDRMKPSKRRSTLEHWLTLEILPRFAGRFVPVDERIADVAGMMVGANILRGHQADSSDALIAATSKVLGVSGCNDGSGLREAGRGVSDVLAV